MIGSISLLSIIIKRAKPKPSMKKHLYFCLLFSIGSLPAFAQAPFNTTDSIDINNINASVLVHGDMWWNPLLGTSTCFYPNGSHKNINFAGGLWLSAYDGAGQLHVAAQTYRQEGNDYWPGPLEGTAPLSYAASQDWAKIWKVNRTDIQSFQSLATHTVANTPPAILTWPAKGNTNAQGNAGVPLIITTDMAPFIDLNGNGIYEPLLGEYPAIKGDQALWWVFNDNGPSHTQTNGHPLSVEIYAMSYAYKRSTLIDDVVYYEYTFINKSANNYSGMRIAQWDDIDLGYFADDFIGFDSIWRMGICYNGTNCDGCASGNPSNSYGVNPPQTAITMIVLPGDSPSGFVPAGSFTTYNNDFSIVGDPNNDTVCHYYMHSRLADGSLISKNMLCSGIDSTTIFDYIFPGDPSDSSHWNECNCGRNPGDRKFILSSSDFPLAAGASTKAVFALIVADSAGGGCGGTSFNKIKIVADTAWSAYHREATAIKIQPTPTQISIYPNPARNQLTIETLASNISDESIAFTNTLGQPLNIPLHKTNRKYIADISSLPPGLYILSYLTSHTQVTMKFIKE
jgi:hypothetical protein